MCMAFFILGLYIENHNARMATGDYIEETARVYIIY